MRILNRKGVGGIGSHALVAIVSLGCSTVMNSGVALAEWEAVQEDVREQIAMLQPPLGPHSIVIDHGTKGKVTLEGYVESEEARRRVQEAAQRAKGVAEVDNKLSVSAWVPQQRSDEVRRIQEAIHREIPQGRYNLTIIAQPDQVILRGSADDTMTRDRLVEVTTSVAKKSVIDEMQIRSLVTDSDIEERIRKVIAREFPNLIKGLEVTSRQGEVTLKGNVTHYREVDKVLASVLNIDGVRNVESDLTVQGRRYSGWVEKSDGK